MINTSIITNSSENIAVAMVQGVNSASDGVFGFMLLIGCYFVIFMPALAKFGVRAAFGSAAFTGAILAIFMRVLGIINDTVMYGSIVVVVLAVIIIWMSRDE